MDEQHISETIIFSDNVFFGKNESEIIIKYTKLDGLVNEYTSIRGTLLSYLLGKKWMEDECPDLITKKDNLLTDLEVAKGEYCKCFDDKRQTHDYLSLSAMNLQKKYNEGWRFPDNTCLLTQRAEISRIDAKIEDFKGKIMDMKTRISNLKKEYNELIKKQNGSKTTQYLIEEVSSIEGNLFSFKEECRLLKDDIVKRRELLTVYQSIINGTNMCG